MDPQEEMRHDVALMNVLRDLDILRNAIRKVRDQKGDDKCWKDLEDLYKLLPEGYTPPERDTLVELENCKAYISSQYNPATIYVSPQREIERLEKELHEANRRLRAMSYFGNKTRQ